MGERTHEFTLPPEVEAVFKKYWTCEFSTLAKDGTPLSWPILPIFQPALCRFVFLTSIGTPQKVFNIRRNRRVSLFYSNPTGSGLIDPPAVLVQGEAQVGDLIITSMAQVDAQIRFDMQEQGRRLLQHQPAIAIYTNNRLTQYLMDWYFMRLLITITPRRIMWWERGDFMSPAYEIEVPDVESYR